MRPTANGGDAAGVVCHGQGAEIVGTMGRVFGKEVGPGASVDLSYGSQTGLNQSDAVGSDAQQLPFDIGETSSVLAL